MKNILNKFLMATALCALPFTQALASSHREAPLIASDPQADNTDVYAFRSPCDSSKVVIIANYIPFQLPQGGPNYYSFGQNIRYEIHIKNKAAVGPGNGDDITYRFTFNVTNQDTTTFFNIRLGKQNQKVTYNCEKSVDGGITFTTIKTGGEVPPNNIGPRSIEGAAGLNAASGYGPLMTSKVTAATTGEQLFAGPADDPFFVDLGGAFDVGNFRKQNAGGRDGLAKYNVSSIVLEIPISMLQKDGKTTAQAANILDGDFVIGVWASTSRQQITTLNANGTPATPTGPFVQISRLGMPLVNEVINPIGQKDRWNSANPYTGDLTYAPNFRNPELALYMDQSQFGGAVPGLADLRIQSASPTVLGNVDFRNGKPGLYVLKGNAILNGTALAPGPSGGGTGFGDILLPDNASPRSVDILPIFYTGVPNLAPYQLFTGKTPGNPLSAGKPFINNFLPTLSDMLRLNMAVPVTPRNSPQFSSLGLIGAAVLGLTNPTYGNTTIQNIPNMDGFPNGRRLEDDVTTIELQAVGGVVLAAVGLFYDDYVINGNPNTPRLQATLAFDAGVTKNDTTFQACMPYVQQPWRGFKGNSYSAPPPYIQNVGISGLNLSGPDAAMVAYPNPFRNQVSFKYKVAYAGSVTIDVVDINGRLIQRMDQGKQNAGEHLAQWNNGNIAAGTYFGRLSINGSEVQAVKLSKTN